MHAFARSLVRAFGAAMLTFALGARLFGTTPREAGW